MDYLKIGFLFLISIFLSNCNNIQNNEQIGSSIHSSKNYLIDTTINDYNIHLKMENRFLDRGDTNRVFFNIDNFEAKNIIIYTSVSEAVVNRGESDGHFKVIPNKQTDKVTINLNLREKTSIKSIGQITLKAK